MRVILVFLLIYCKVRAFQPPYFTSKRVGVIPRTAASFPEWRGSTVNKLRDELFTSRDSTVRELFRYPDLPSVSKSQAIQRNTIHGIFRKKIGRWTLWIRRAFAAVTIFFLVHLSSLNPAWAGQSGGRMGGSFKPSSSYSTRSSPRTSSRISTRPAPIRVYHRPAPRIIMHNRPPVNVYSSPVPSVALRTFHGPTVRRRVTMSDVVLLTGAGTLITYNVMNHYQRNGGPRSALGPGVSVVSLTVSLNVPDRDNSNSILSRLTRKAQTSRTDTRKGVQDMISETSLELLRQERTIVSVDSDYQNFRSLTEAEREFNSLSINKRSKFDRETGKFHLSLSFFQ
jgi:hypothetical protein